MAKYYHSAWRGRNGFTLLELLIATAVAGLVLVLLLQVVGNTSEITQSTEARIESRNDLRRALDRISTDLTMGIFSDDLPPYFEKATGNDRLGFYSEVTGYGGLRRLSKVEYRISPESGLQRGVRGHSWTAESPVPFGENYLFDLEPTEFDNLGELIFRMEWEVILADGRIQGAENITSWDDVRAVLVTVVSVDPRAWKRRSSGQAQTPDGSPGDLTLEALARLFPDSSTGSSSTSIFDDWSGIVQNPSESPLAILPANLAGTLQVRQRMIPVLR